jgi:hypothetical protein
MIIRATNKLLNNSGIKPIKNLSDPIDNLPGEWYAATISMLRPGKIVVHFLHYPTFITILIPGKSLNKVIPLLPDRTSSLLKRNGYSKLEFLFQLHLKPEIFATNSRSMLAHMNQIRYNIEYHFAEAESIESIDYDKIEDIFLDYLFGNVSMPSKFVTSLNLLDDLLKNHYAT